MIEMCILCKVMTHKKACPICGTSDEKYLRSRQRLEAGSLCFENDPTPDNAILAAQCQEALVVMINLQGELV